jgi:hypothetical protein
MHLGRREVSFRVTIAPVRRGMKIALLISTAALLAAGLGICGETKSAGTPGKPGSDARAGSGCLRAGTVVEELEAAMQAAKRDKKDMVLSFSGYRWWWPCEGINFEPEDPWFGKRFILVTVPMAGQERDAAGERAVIALRKKFDQELQEPGPVILLLDADGRPYADIDSNEQPPEIYIPEFTAALARRKVRDEAFSQARQAKGLAAARLLDKGLRSLYEVEDGFTDAGENLLVGRYYRDVMTEIAGNDPKDSLGRGKELEERRQWEAEDRKTAATRARLGELAKTLNAKCDSGSSLPELFAAIDGFLMKERPPSEFGRQAALMGKAEVALFLHDYKAGQQALNDLSAAFPADEGCKELVSKVRPEVEKASVRSAAGTDTAVTYYEIRLDGFALGEFDADGEQTRMRLRELNQDVALLSEDMLHRRLQKVRLLLSLREYDEALRELDRFTNAGSKTGQVMLRDKELRPVILKGLRKTQAPGQGTSDPPSERSNAK